MLGIKGDLAVLYRAMRHMGVPVPQVNEMELWEVAVAFGLDEDLTQRNMPPKLVSKGERAPMQLEDLPPTEQVRVLRALERAQAARAKPVVADSPI